MKDMEKPYIGDWGEGFVVKGLPKIQVLPITGTIKELKEHKELTEVFLEKLETCKIDFEIKIQEPCEELNHLFELYKGVQTQIVDFGGRWYSPKFEADIINVVATEEGGVYLDLSAMEQINPHAEKFYGKFLNWVTSVYYKIRWKFVRHRYEEIEEKEE